MRPRAYLRSALIRHDALICRNSLGRAFRRWSDRATFLAGAPLLALITHDAADALSDRTVALLGAAGGAMTGYFMLRLAMRRLDYHRTEGVLAAEALQRRASTLYAFTLVALGVVLGSAMVAAVVWRALPGFTLALPCGFAAGALITAASGHAPLPRAAGPIVRGVNRRLDRLSTGLLLALPVTAGSSIAAATASPRDALAIAAVVTAVGALALVHADAARIRFMAQCGYRADHACLLEVAPLAIFTLATAVAAAALFGLTGAAVVAAVPFALLLVQPPRVMLYRSHGRRTADWLFTGVLVALALTCLLAPLAIPLTYAALLAGLARHTRPARWRIA